MMKNMNRPLNPFYNAKVLCNLAIVCSLLFIVNTHAFAQFRQMETATKPKGGKYAPLTFKINEDGSHYVRFILWHQMWATTNNLETDGKLQINPSIRRSRVLAYAQLTDKFLFLTHFGLNNFNTGNQTALGNRVGDDAAQLFLHDAWGEIKINDWLYAGSGLHYWKGLTRLANASTLNFMTLDQGRPFAQWHSIGITDQFARHFGVYVKGQKGKFDYRMALNAPGRNGLGGGANFGNVASDLTYDGFNNLNTDGDPTGNTIVEGYFRYNFWETESTKLPYQVGSYLGQKKVFGIGAGFFLHPNGMYNSSNGEHDNVSHFAIDAFIENPLPNGNMIHAYASIISFDYGENYVSRWAGTGTNFYGQLGYYLDKSQLMPYVAYQHGNYDGLADPISTIDLGMNYFIQGHNCKITLEYHRINGDIREAAIATQDDALSQLRLQLHVFL